MAEYPRALRTAHHVVYFHQANARAFVAGKIAEAIQAKQDAQAAEWQKIGRFVERLLTIVAGVQPPAARQTRRPQRYRRVRTPTPH